jgi:uncharacterized protein (TIGR03437 family)
MRTLILFCRTFTVLALAAAAFAQAPTINGVASTADFSPNLCPGEPASIFGSNFGSDKSAVKVTFGGNQAYVIVATPSQINLQIPFEAATGDQNVVVTVGSSASAPFKVTLRSYAPKFFTQNGAGTGPASAYTNPGGVLITEKAPAKLGDALLAYAVGLGPTSPATATGVPTAVANTASVATLTIGGVNTKVDFAGVITAAAGTYQVNFTVPAGIQVQGSQPLVISIGGASSSNKVTLPLPGITTIQNNGSFGSDGTAAPGSIVSVKGNALGIDRTAHGISGYKISRQSGDIQRNGGASVPFGDVGDAAADRSAGSE